MNFLAHFYLARSDKGLIVGNLLANYALGKKYLDYPENIQKGILLHRKIDSFTDTHPEMHKTKLRLREKYRKYAPVISDVYYDYFLGRNWNDYSDVSLKSFTQEIYNTLHEHHTILPPRAQITLEYMARQDWLFHYSTYYGIEKALQGLSRRARFENNMELAIGDLKSNEKNIEKEFRPFFQSLQEFVQEEINK